MIKSTNEPIKLLSVVVPAFNEENSVSDLVAQLNALSSVLMATGTEIELVIVSDGSTDSTFEIAQAEIRKYGLRGTAIELLTNVGSHKAIRCGLEISNGDAIIVMSADGQDPVDAIPQMLEKLDSGFDVVWGERQNRSADSFVARSVAYVFYGFFRVLSGIQFPRRGLDFVMITRRVSMELGRYRERNAAIHLIIFNSGYSSTTVPYVRHLRKSGTSKWTFRKRLKLAIDMLTGSSFFLLRVIVLSGVCVGFAGLVFGVITFIRALSGDTGETGWASLMVTTSIIGGLVLVGLGIIGEYLGRALDEIRSRPLFTIDKVWTSTDD
jgi:glycosyltransferase involved in cell wall biosynthesis